MKNSFIELGKDGRVIEWRRHLLSGPVEARGLGALVFEPYVHPKGAFGDRLLEVVGDASGVSWSWRKGRDLWDFVGIESTDGSSRYIFRDSGKGPRISWRELNYCESVELTPYRHTGEAGATVRVERPLTLTGGEINFDQRFAGGPVRVRVPAHSGTGDLVVQLFRPDVDHEFVPEGRAVAFNSDGMAEVAARELRRFFGVIAVIRSGSRRRLLLHYRAYASERPGSGRLAGEIINDDERRRLRRAVQMRESEKKSPYQGALGAWLDLWPSRSQKFLDELYQHALRQMSPGAAAQSLRHTPAGLLRHVVLSLYNLHPGGPVDQRIQQLSGGTFDEALESISPTLPSLIASLRSPAEVEWVMGHANHPRLSDVVGWAGDRGSAALDTALMLVEVRAKALELKNRLRHDSPEGQEIAELLADIERAPDEAGAHPRDFLLRLDEVVRRVRHDEQRPVHAEGEAPVTQERYQTWLREREKTLRWRRELAQVLDYCESGELKPHDEAPTPESLERRLRQLEKPSALDAQGREDELGEEVRRLAQKLSDGAEDETRDSVRSLARAQLQKVIIPHSGVWAQMHGNIRKARSLSSAYAWFAERSGLSNAEGNVNERRRASETFLQLVEAAEAFAKGWVVKSQHLKRSVPGGSELMSILSVPDHPWPRAAHERCAELYRLLSHSSFTQGVRPPAAPPAPPDELSVHSLKAWWEQLLELDLVMSRLEWGEKRFESSAKSLKEDLLPTLRGCMAYWKRLPPSERPAYFDDLSASYEKCFGQDGVVTPSNLEELLTFLNRAQWRRDCKGVARGPSERV